MFTWPKFGDYCATLYPMCRVARMSIPDTLTIPEWTKGNRLRRAREAAGLTQNQLSELISISRRQIIDYESDKKNPTRGHLLLWQMMTRVPAEWLEHGPNGTPPNNGIPGNPTKITNRYLAPVTTLEALAA